MVDTALRAHHNPFLVPIVSYASAFWHYATVPIRMTPKKMNDLVREYIRLTARPDRAHRDRLRASMRRVKERKKCHS